MARIHGWAVAAAGLLACTTTAFAEEVREYVENGVRYRETRSKVMRPVTETRFEERERTVYREQYSSETEEYTRLVNVPVTEYRWEAYWAGWFNPFAKPHLAYRYVPVTRWETRTETVRRPIARRELVPERVVERVPVTQRRMVEEEVTRRVAVSNDPFDGRPTVANRNSIGGTQLQSDPPREGTDWRAGGIRR